MSIFPIKTLEHGGHHTQAALFTATAWAHSKQGLCGEGIPRRLREHFKYLLQHFCCWNWMWVKTTLSNSKSTGDLWNREGGSRERYQVSIKLIFFLIQPGSVRCHGQLIRVAAQFILSVQSKRYYPVRVCVCVCVAEEVALSTSSTWIFIWSLTFVPRAFRISWKGYSRQVPTAMREYMYSGLTMLFGFVGGGLRKWKAGTEEQSAQPSHSSILGI